MAEMFISMIRQVGSTFRMVAPGKAKGLFSECVWCGMFNITRISEGSENKGMCFALHGFHLMSLKVQVS